jgi:hypothetical protein
VVGWEFFYLRRDKDETDDILSDRQTSQRRK